MSLFKRIRIRFIDALSHIFLYPTPWKLLKPNNETRRNRYLCSFSRDMPRSCSHTKLEIMTSKSLTITLMRVMIYAILRAVTVALPLQTQVLIGLAKTAKLWTVTVTPVIMMMNIKYPRLKFISFKIYILITHVYYSVRLFQSSD